MQLPRGGTTCRGRGATARDKSHSASADCIGPEVPKDKGYIVKEIRDGLYWVGDGSYNTMFLVHETGVIAVDAPITIGQKYLSAIADVTSKPITHVIYSHAHTDHIGSAGMFPKEAVIIAQEETAGLLKRYRDPRRPVPQVTFKDHYVLDVGGQVLRLDYHGPIHVAGNTFIYAPKQKVLMLVDVAFPGWIPYKNLADSQTSLSTSAGTTSRSLMILTRISAAM